jgi:hypothetical protein
MPLDASATDSYKNAHISLAISVCLSVHMEQHKNF